METIREVTRAWKNGVLSDVERADLTKKCARSLLVKINELERRAEIANHSTVESILDAGETETRAYVRFLTRIIDDRYEALVTKIFG